MAGARVPRGRRLFAARFRILLDVAGQHRVSLLARTPKFLNQPVIRPGVDMVGGKHAHVSPSAL